MNLPPLTFADVTLLLAINAIVLLITSELSSPEQGQTNLTINKKKLKIAALTTGTAFLITVAITIANIITST